MECKNNDVKAHSCRTSSDHDVYGSTKSHDIINLFTCSKLKAT